MIIRSKWTLLVFALSLIGQMLFNGPVLISKAVGNAVPSSTGIGPPTYWSNCVHLAREQATRPQTPEPSALDGCYQRLLAKFGMKLLSDISTNPLAFFSGLLQMQKQNQQPSVVQQFIHLGAPGYSSLKEKQELISVDSNYVDRGKVDPKLVKGYNAAIDKPLFDQFVKQQLPVLSSHKLDQWFTSVILTIPAIMKQACDIRQPSYNPSPRVDSPDSSHTGDLPYLGGHVIDGIANVYLIYWVDESIQPFDPQYVSLTEQFVKDFVRSPLYTNLLQYHDALDQCPTGARLTGTFVDKRPFPPSVVAERSDPNITGDQLHQDIDDAARKEIAGVAAKNSWNTQDYHNVYGMLLPIVDSKPGGCGGGAHNWLHIGANGKQNGSPFMFLPYSCGFLTSSSNQDTNAQDAPNQDIAADNMIGVISHEFSETVSDPYVDGWTGNGGEMADKCPLPPDTIDPQAHGNVTWNGHHYVIQEEYSNLRHSCVLQGP